MQSIEARSEYRNTLHCAARIVREESILAFWSGAVPRLVRLSLSGGIVFTMYVLFLCGNCCGHPPPTQLTDMFYRYEKTMELMDTLDPERKLI